MPIGPKAMLPIAAALMFAVLGRAEPAVAAECTAESKGLCDCDLTKLRPLQGALGMKEVDNKSADYKKGKKSAPPIVVVFGPGNEFFIIDHHHGAAAWLQAGHEKGTCQVVNDEKQLSRSYTNPGDEDAFWNALTKKNLVWLEDEHGKKIDHKDLPSTIKTMPDDPYRSLVWLVREKKGFCKGADAPDFMEFAWADWFRPQYDENVVKGLPSDPKGADNTVKDAVVKAHSDEAKNAHLPGYSAHKCSTNGPA